MAPTLLSAAITCVCSLFLGQAVLRLCGATRWSWLAPPVGVSVVMLIAVPAIHVPGRSATVAVIVIALTFLSILWCGASAAHRPPWRDLLTVLPLATLVLIPSAAAGHFGIPGSGFDNDLAYHFLWAEGFVSRAVTTVTPLPTDYPLGPHAMAALIAKGFDIRIDHAFTGWIMALPLLTGWTALGLVRRASWLGKAAVATVVGMPFLVAAYYGEGSFKEVLMGGLVLGLVASLDGRKNLPAGRRQWVPLALILGGMVSAYSVAGLVWPVVIVGVWAMVEAGLRLRSDGREGLVSSVRGQLPALGVGAAVLIVTLLPQAERISSFISVRHASNGTGIESSVLGNLIGSLPGWEAFGVWNNPDFRVGQTPALSGDLLTGLAVTLAVLGAVWALRRRRWTLALAPVGAMLIWAVSSISQSPYVNAKALAIASPVIVLLAMLPLVERSAGRRLWLRIAVPVVALAFLVTVVVSDVGALRFSPVGSVDQLKELRALRPALNVERTLFLGDDDFIHWELAAVPVKTAVFGGSERLPARPQKRWATGRAVDFDTLSAATLNRYRWVITTHDAAGSEPPPQMHLVLRTENFDLWQRRGTVAERSVLDEGEDAGALLDCGSAQGRAILREGGVAAIRRPPVSVAVPPIHAGSSTAVRLPLSRGAWQLGIQYTSETPLDLSWNGWSRELQSNLTRPGPRWPIGRIDVVGEGKGTTIGLHAQSTTLTAPSTVAEFGDLTATPISPSRTVPIAEACGKYVDWYEPAPG